MIRWASICYGHCFCTDNKLNCFNPTTKAFMNPALRKIVPQPIIRIARRAWATLTFSPMMTAYVDREAFFSRAMSLLSTNGIDGDYVEAFDSFQGMPTKQCEADEHPEWIAGAMATSLEQFLKICKRNHIPPNRYTTVKGFYSDTLNSSSNSWPAPLSAATLL
jgi:hypothetical protein